MKFYDCATAPSPRRVRMFIAEKKLDIPVVEVDLASLEQHSEAFAKINPYRTVPVLELDDGAVLTSSYAICRYLEDLHPEPALMGRDALERAQIVDLDLRIEQEGFLAVGEAFRNRAKSFKNNAMPGKHEYAQIPELAERGRSRALQFINWLDTRLSGHEFIAGDEFTVADITAFTTIEFARWIKLEAPQECVNFHRWNAAVSERSSAST